MADINLGMIPERWIQDIGDVGPRGAKDRNPLKIENVQEIPRSHPVARMEAFHEAHKFQELALQAIHFLRRHQIEKIVLDDMEEKSKTYGDRIGVSCDLSSEDIQKKVDELNFTVGSSDAPLENEATKDDELRKKELGYISRFKAKAFVFFNKSSKRRDKLSHVEHDIDYHKEILQNHLFHNYNICAILCGRIKPSDDYEGLYPDPIDYKYVQAFIKSQEEEKAKAVPYITNIRIENLVKTPIDLKKEDVITNNKKEEEKTVEQAVKQEEVKKEEPKVETVVEKRETQPTPTIIREQVKPEAIIPEERVVPIPSVDTVINTSEKKEDVGKKPLKVRVTKVKPNYVNSSNNREDKIDILRMLSDDVKNKYVDSESKGKTK